MNADEQQIVELYRRFHRDKVNKDTEDLGRFLTDDFVLVHMSGLAQSRREWFEEIDNERMRYFSSVEEGHECRVEGNAATLVGRNRVDARIYGNRRTWPLQLTFRYVKVDGRWRIASATATTY